MSKIFSGLRYDEDIISRLKFSFKDGDLGFSLYMDKPEIWKAVLITILRKSFPYTYIEVLDLPKLESIKPYWKRLFQNLGIICDKAPRTKREYRHKLDLAQFENLNTILSRKTLIAKVSGPSSIIPPKLLL